MVPRPWQRAGQVREVHEKSKDDACESIETSTREAVIGSILSFPATHSFYDDKGTIQGMLLSRGTQI
jgi:D-alanine-D-alanine ligase-like ATP-grasp enzyme